MAAPIAKVTKKWICKNQIIIQKFIFYGKMAQKDAFVFAILQKKKTL